MQFTVMTPRGYVSSPVEADDIEAAALAVEERGEEVVDLADYLIVIADEPAPVLS